MAGLTFRIAGEAAPLRADWLAEAPRSTALLCRLFAQPRKTRLRQATFDGPELMAAFAAEALSPAPDLAAAIRALPVENATCFPAPGDCYWVRIPAGALPGGNPEVWEVAMAYAPGVRLFGPLGWMPGNVFARLAPAPLARIAADIRENGARDIRIAAEG